MSTSSPNENSAEPMFFADYSQRDFEVVNYRFYELPGIPKVGFRGPELSKEVLDSGNYFTVFGAAQSLGVYVEKPYPDLLAERIGLPALNLSLGGINPGYFADNDVLLQLANGGSFVVLQVMTARTEPNDRIEPIGISMVRDLKTGATDIPEAVWARVINEDREQLPGYIAQNLSSWHAAYTRLLSRLKVPVILFYFSYKPDDERIDYAAKDWEAFYGSFPQFVGMDDVRKVAALCTSYAECRSNRELGHLILSRFTGKPVEIDFSVLHSSASGKFARNHYYPSPQMHEDAVPPLEAAIRQLGLAR